MKMSTYENGFDPEPESDYSTTWKEFDIKYDVYGNIYGVTSEAKKSYLESRILSPY